MDHITIASSAKTTGTRRDGVADCVTWMRLQDMAMVKGEATSQ